MWGLLGAGTFHSGLARAAFDSGGPPTGAKETLAASLVSYLLSQHRAAFDVYYPSTQRTCP